MKSPIVRLASTGPEFSRIVLGMWRLAEWNLSHADLLSFVDACLDLGVTTVDHADIYGDYAAESLFGEALAISPGLRERLQLVSKCGIKLVSARRPEHKIKHYDTSRAHLVASVENSLRNLHTDRLDLLLIHRPDPLLDADEVADAFRLLRESGKVLHFGVSNFAPFQLELLAARYPLVTNQVEASPMRLEPFLDGTLDQCQRLGLAPMIWSPLAGGRLFTEDNPRAQRIRERLSTIGAELGASATVVAYAWLLRHPSRPLALAGSRRIEAVGEAVAACALSLTRQHWFDIWRASTGNEVA